MMNIVICTNIYTSHVSGMATSIHVLTRECLKSGHKVLVVAPRLPDAEENDDSEDYVVRFPVIQHPRSEGRLNAVPMSAALAEAVHQFAPDIVHSHHPIWSGSIALQIASRESCPLVFTHHTTYEHHAYDIPAHLPHGVPVDCDLATTYANFADQVIAPSPRIAVALKNRGVQRPIAVVPTGVDIASIQNGDRNRARRRYGLDLNSFVIGYVGRLTPEKNLPFLAAATAAFARTDSKAEVLIVGEGPLEKEIRLAFAGQGVPGRLHMTGVLSGQDLADAYSAMDLFAFASVTETRGPVIIEAMAAGLPVVAIDVNGVRDIVHIGHNGVLLPREDCYVFGRALTRIRNFARDDWNRLCDGARETAAPFDAKACVKQMIQLYESLKDRQLDVDASAPAEWETVVSQLGQDFELRRDCSRASNNSGVPA